MTTHYSKLINRNRISQRSATTVYTVYATLVQYTLYSRSYIACCRVRRWGWLHLQRARCSVHSTDQGIYTLSRVRLSCLIELSLHIGAGSGTRAPYKVCLQYRRLFGTHLALALCRTATGTWSGNLVLHPVLDMSLSALCVIRSPKPGQLVANPVPDGLGPFLAGCAR